MAKQTKQLHKGDKKTGFAHFIAAAGYSYDGFKFMCSEVPFRHELCALFVLLIILLLVGANSFSMVLVLAFGVATIAVECINSAIELIVDRTSPEVSEYAKNAKDVGSFAVLCMMLATGVIALYGIVSAF